MADWTSIPDATFDPDRPVLGSTHLAIVKNFEALAEGASGAPRVLDAALGATVTTAGTDWVLARNANATTGAVGTYAFLGETGNVTTNPGGTRAGSNLRYANVVRVSSGASNAAWSDSAIVGGNTVGGSGTPAGTWRSMGFNYSANAGDDDFRRGATLWLRIS